MSNLNFNAANVKPAVVAEYTAPARQWSQYQQNIFTFAKTGIGNAIIKAVAGSGKSSTIIEAMNCVSGSAIFLAFNKAIADELKAKGVNAKTFHSLTYSAVTRARNTRNIESGKLFMIVTEKLSGDDVVIYGSFIVKLVSLGRQMGIGCLVADTDAAWLELVNYFDLEIEDERGSLTAGIMLASKLLEWSNADKRVDFDDLLYLAVKDGLSLPKFDFVFVDEAQDTNAIQRAILRKIMHSGSRMIAVGDPAQAIYGFRGADSNSLQLIADEFDCQWLPLTVTYRCPTAVVEYAQQWVSDIEAAPGAAAGEVINLNKWDTSTFKADDLVVCRTTKPLMSLAFKFIRAGIPARIMGREIGEGLKTLILKQKTNDIDTLITRLDLWATREVEKAIAKRNESKVETIRDKFEAIKTIADSLGEHDRTVSGLVAVITELFSDYAKGVTLATIHKSKGLEANRVVWLNSSKCPSKWAKSDWQKQQELNLCYVATTRAKQTLLLIEDEGGKRG